MEQTLFELKHSGFNPTYIMDIGANKGEWSHLCSSVFPEANYTLIDAEDTMMHHQNCECFNCYPNTLLGKEEGTVTFYKRRNETGATGNSYFKENTPFFSDCIEEERTVVTLDSLNLPSPELLKIDVQGAELDILCGAKQTIENTKFILMEVVTLDVVYNVGSPSHIEVMKFMELIDFHPRKKIGDIYVLGQHVQSDWLFSRGI